MTTPIAFLVLLGVLITVHELGHFLVAKACGVRVLVFSIGFGPKLIGFTRGGTEYRVSMLPLGGYVRMYGDDITEEVPASERAYAFLEKPFLQKASIAAAGPIANLLLPIALFFALFVGHERVADAVVGTVLPGEPAARAGFAVGDRIVAVNGAQVHAFGDVQQAIAPRAGQPTVVTVERDGARKDLQVTPVASSVGGPSPVGRLGILASKELPVIVPLQGSAAHRAGLKPLERIVAVDGTPTPTRAALAAALAALPADRAVDVEVEASDRGSAAASPEDQTTATSARRRVVLAPEPPSSAAVPDIALDRFAVTSDELDVPSLHTHVLQTQALVRDELLAVRARRGIMDAEAIVDDVMADTPAAARGLTARAHRVVAVDGKPVRLANDLEAALRTDVDAIHVIGLVDVAADATGAGSGRVFALRMQKSPRREHGGIKVAGIALASTLGEPGMLVRNVDVATASKRAVVETAGTVGAVFAGLRAFFTGDAGLDQVAGPFTIASLAGEAARSGIDIFVRLMALLSVNLAVLNLLPIPVLDGGHLLLFTVEAVRRRRLSVDARLRVTRVGVFIVLGLTLLALGNDLLGLF